ncbi:MAG: sugar transferase [Akkermansia sp.]|nr:sugar transferase [Akkermansia sp.]
MYTNSTARRHIFQMLDALLIFVCLYAAKCLSALAASSAGGRLADTFSFTDLISASATALIILVLLDHSGFYRKGSLQRPLRAFQQITGAWIAPLFALCLYQISSDASPEFRCFLWASALSIPLVIFIRHISIYYYLSCVDCSPKRLKSVILMGERDYVTAVWDRLPHTWKRSFALAGVYDPNESSTHDLQNLLVENSVSHVLLFGGFEDTYRMRDAVRLCMLLGVDIYMGETPSHPFTGNIRFERVADCHFCVYRNAPILSWGYIFKSIFDRLAAAALMLLSSPFWLLAACLIKAGDRNGPVFYKQKRSGMYGKEFTMWKFRSMYSDAEQRLNKVKEEYGNDMNGPVFKLEHDPRIIPFGHFLRKTSIDELPQLINVLKGDMSLVGPRPLPVYETAAFPDLESRRRLTVKPGLTCYWQIEGRSNTTDFKDLIEKDMKYIDNWSFWLDLWLLLRTIPAVFCMRGAK